MDIKKIMQEIDKRKEAIAKERDKLREISAELSDCLYAFDDGLDELEDCKITIGRAIERISEVV